jgi:hypothetical protein
MLFGLIQPAIRRATIADFADIQAAQRSVGLSPGEVDFGGVPTVDERRLHIVVFEFSFFVPAHAQNYFAIGGSPYAGAAVLFASDIDGATIDLAPPLPPIEFFDDAQQFEAAIKLGAVIRPEIKINGMRVWAWPEPAPR